MDTLLDVANHNNNYAGHLYKWHYKCHLRLYCNQMELNICDNACVQNASMIDCEVICHTTLKSGQGCILTTFNTSINMNPRSTPPWVEAAWNVVLNSLEKSSGISRRAACRIAPVKLFRRLTSGGSMKPIEALVLSFYLCQKLIEVSKLYSQQEQWRLVAY